MNALSSERSLSKPVVGFIGVGEMGEPIVHTLLTAGYPVIAYDLDDARLVKAESAGAVRAPSTQHLVQQSDIVAASLPSSSAFVQVAEYELLPCVRAGQTVIDFGTVTPPETRRLAALFAEKDVVLLDVPLSGGPVGATRAQLYMFAGGNRAAFERMRPLLETVGGSERLTYCGPAGSGQVVKGVNQLMMGIVSAAYLEALAFGVNEGVDAEVIRTAIGDEGRRRADFCAVATRVVDGEGLDVGVKFRELPYYLCAAAERGYDLPITEAVRAYCEQGESVTVDDHREAPSYWHELMKGSRER